jgi:hypothetical protein
MPVTSLMSIVFWTWEMYVCIVIMKRPARDLGGFTGLQHPQIPLPYICIHTLILLLLECADTFIFGFKETVTCCYLVKLMCDHILFGCTGKTNGINQTNSIVTTVAQKKD